MTRGKLAAKHVALPLALGALSYLVWRSALPFWPSHVALWKSAPSVLRDHFADGAWGWALGAFVSIVWLGERTPRRAAWIGVAALVAGGVECLQYAHVLRGAFDPVDLVVQVGAVVLAASTVGGTRKWISAPV
ncbi:MAG TPA: hypothetical protein VGH28_15500 [Polyangiaceae bacterium]